MPLVLATGAATESGHSYADVLGISYVYPDRYRNFIKPGEPFVYYRGRRRQEGGTQPQVYLGCGTIGAISGAGRKGLLVCAIDDYVSFPEPVFFKRENGQHLEPGGARAGYFQPGVRRVTAEVYRSIILRGIGNTDDPTIDAAPPGYAIAADTKEIEDVSRRAAVAHLTERPGIICVTQMPTNNPGFDLLAETTDGPLYVEVKGTRGDAPRFFMSEGERLFATAHKGAYLLLVVTGIDPAGGSWDRVRVLADPPTPANAALREHQWRGELPL